MIEKVLNIREVRSNKLLPLAIELPGFSFFPFRISAKNSLLPSLWQRWDVSVA